MAQKQSILTTLTDEKIAAQHPTMSRESLAWLNDKVRQLKNPTSMIRPLVREKQRYTRPTDRQNFLIGGL